MTKKEKEEKRCEFAKAAMAAIVQAQWTTNALKTDESAKNHILIGGFNMNPRRVHRPGRC